MLERCVHRIAIADFREVNGRMVLKCRFQGWCLLTRLRARGRIRIMFGIRRLQGTLHFDRRLQLERLRVRGVGKQFIHGYLLREARSQERVVRGVLQQSSNEIRHPGNQLTVGHIHPQAVPPIDDCPLLRIGHAVQHLDFQTRRRQLKMLGDGKSVRDAPKVVRSECGSKMLMVLKHETSGPFEAGVGLPLLLKHGNGPARGLSMNGLVIPVRSLDQPDPDGMTASLGPIPQLDKILNRVAQVTLNHDSHVAMVAKLRFHQDRLEHSQRKILLVIRLHVDIDESSMRPRHAQQFA